jgi:hypothetical protein
MFVHNLLVKKFPVFSVNFFTIRTEFLNLELLIL